MVSLCKDRDTIIYRAPVFKLKFINKRHPSSNNSFKITCNFFIIQTQKKYMACITKYKIEGTFFLNLGDYLNNFRIHVFVGNIACFKHWLTKRCKYK